MKKMSKWLVIAAVILAPMCAFAGILDGAPFTFTGKVTDYIGNGGGMVLEDVTIYGIGPLWFWEANNYDRPEIGEEVTVTGYTYKDRNIAFTVGDFVLRNPLTGLPLWSKAKAYMNSQQKKAKAMHRGGQAD